MTFEEAAQQFTTLRQQRDMGALPEAHFRAAVAQLVVADAQGNYWGLDPDTAQWVPYAASTPTNWSSLGTPAPAAPVSPEQGAAAAPAYEVTYQQTQAAPGMPAAGVAPAQRRGWPQQTWDIISVVGNAILSAGWYLYSGMAETKPDYLTCGAMLVLPISFVIFRKPLDSVLRSLQPLRSKIPTMVLAGCCVAVPFLISNYLFALGVRQFPFMFSSYVLSTVLSFILMRQPAGGTSANMPPGVSRQAGTI